MDAIHYKVREDKQVVIKAAYVVIGINLDGEKEVLGIWIGANESSKFWLSVLNDLKNRGVQNVLIFCIDGLNGFRKGYWSLLSHLLKYKFSDILDEKRTSN